MNNTINTLNDIMNISTYLHNNYLDTNVLNNDKILELKDLIETLSKNVSKENSLELNKQDNYKMDPDLLITTRFNNPIDYMNLLENNKDVLVDINKRILTYQDFLVNSRELSCLEGQNSINQQIIQGIKNKYGPNSENNFLILSKYRADALANNLRTLSLETGPRPFTANDYLIEKVLNKLSEGYRLEINIPSPIAVAAGGPNMYETVTMPSYVIFIKQDKGVCIGEKLHHVPGTEAFIQVSSENTWNIETWDTNKLDLLKIKSGISIKKGYVFTYEKVRVQGTRDDPAFSIMGQIGDPIYDTNLNTELGWSFEDITTA